jgi:transcriptional regulator with XRE-family HTH domain
MDYARTVKAIMAAGDLTQSALAKRLQTTQPTISRILRGAKPEVALHSRIEREAKRFGVIRDSTDESHPTVPIVGYVGVGGTAHFYAVGDANLDRVAAPIDANDLTVALEVRGDALGPLFDKCLILYDELRLPPTPDLIGRLCVIGLPDDRVTVAKLLRSRSPGLFHVIGHELPILDATVSWASRVKEVVQR